ncbi:MAG: hypothetical protein AB1798_18115 [Spirochaetota bacterium]
MVIKRKKLTLVFLMMLPVTILFAGGKKEAAEKKEVTAAEEKAEVALPADALPLLSTGFVPSLPRAGWYVYGLYEDDL